ncbi:Protein of unknown function [Bacillus cereus]|nr:Protein of unknown function [Bacillus cereus]
MKLSKKLKQV